MGMYRGSLLRKLRGAEGKSAANNALKYGLAFIFFTTLLLACDPPAGPQPQPQPTVEPPTFSPAGADLGALPLPEVSSTGSLEIRSGTDGATIRYTIGLTPPAGGRDTLAAPTTTTGTQYSTSPTFATLADDLSGEYPKNITIKAIAVLNGRGSTLRTATYTVVAPTPGLTFDIDGTPPSQPIPIAENSASAITYRVVLDSEITSNVVVNLSVDNAGVTLNPTTLTFEPLSPGNPRNWNRPQEVTITTPAVTTDTTITITHTVNDADSDNSYDGISEDATFTVTNSGILVSSNALSVNEGAFVDYTVTLDGVPTSTVTITVGGAGSEATISRVLSDGTPGVGSTVTFEAGTANWNQPQTVRVTANNNMIDDLPLTLTHTAASSDANYSGVTGPEVMVTITDDDTRGFAFTEQSFGTLTAGGGTGTYEVALTSKPTADVTVTAVSRLDVATVGGIGILTLNFTTENWNVPQQVTVTGVGSGTTTISHSASGGDYNGTIDTVTVTVP